jgi:hypothetical protein
MFARRNLTTRLSLAQFLLRQFLSRQFRHREAGADRSRR